MICKFCMHRSHVYRSCINGSSCIVGNNTEFALDVASLGIRTNGPTPTNVSFTLKSSRDNIPTKTKIAYELVTPTILRSKLLINDLHVSDTAESMTFSGTASTSGQLQENNTIVVTAGTPIFEANATPAVSFVEGLSSDNCRTNGVAEVDSSGKLFTLILKNKNQGQNCILSNSANFVFSISAGIAKNSDTPRAVTFTMYTTQDDVPTESKTAYKTVYPLVLSPSLSPNTVFEGETPEYLDFSFQTSDLQDQLS